MKTLLKMITQPWNRFPSVKSLESHWSYSASPADRTDLILIYYTTSFSLLSLNCSYAWVSPSLCHKDLVFAVFWLGLQKTVACLSSEPLPCVLEGFDECEASLSEVEFFLFVDFGHFLDGLVALVVLIEVSILQFFIFCWDELQQIIFIQQLLDGLSITFVLR